MPNNTTFKGFLYGAIAASSYGLNPLFALPLYAEGMSPDSVLFYRYGFGMLMLAILMKVQGCSFRLRKCEILPLVAMGLFFALSSLTLFVSYNYMDAGIASTILFVYPVLVAMLAVTGISLLYKGDGGETLSLIGVLMVFLSSLTYAIYIIGVNRSVLKDMPIAKLTFYVLVFGTGLFLVRLRFGLDLEVISTPAMWINPIGLALFPTVISLITMTKSIHYIGSTPAAILGALEPITALVIGVAVFGEKLTPRIIWGIVLILTAVTLIIVGKSLIQMIRSKVLQKIRLMHRIR